MEKELVLISLLQKRLAKLPDIHFASTDPNDPNFSSTWFQWTDIIETKIPRDYQLETYRLALVKDVISVLPTGFGKTLTAIMLISRMARMNRICRISRIGGMKRI